MHELLPFLIGTIVLVVLVEMLATKIRVAYPILLVLAGLIVSSIPSIPSMKLDPDIIFFVFLPPLLSEAAWSISFKEMKRWWRIIGSFSFLVVFFTAGAVAFFANHFIPGFSIALGFLLGGIVSPPDAVSAGAILKFVKVPKSTATILEGESLFNDASSLIIFRFALIAIGTGQFIWSDAILSFGWMVIGGAGIGLALAWICAKAHKWLPTDAPSDITFTLVEPYILYWVAEQFHSSGVMAVVCGGLYLANRRYDFLSPESRINGLSFWENFVFILNGLVFFIIGLDFPEVVAGLKSAGIPLETGLYYGVIVAGLVILLRIIASYIAMLFTLLFRRQAFTQNLNYKQAWRIPIFLGWTGMRGVVTLAAALSIPLYLETGEPFPHRELILFISFVVIIITLFLQGLTLPFMIKRIETSGLIAERESDEVAANRLRKEVWKHSIVKIQETNKDCLVGNVELATAFAHWQEKLDIAEEELFSQETKMMYLELLEIQRQYLIEKNNDPKLDESIIRKHLFLIDLEEERIKAL
ncbi:MAG: Na+/H+ antiporter [Cytophagaceae bacterium]